MKPAGCLLAMAAGLLAVPALAKSPPVWPAGIYSNVRMSGETGDLGGMEIRFYDERARHMVEFVWCEGWCNETFKVPVVRTKDGKYAFSYFQRYADGGVDAGVTMRFVAWFEAEKLRVSAWQGQQRLDHDGRPQTLRRAEAPYGITVATSGSEGAAD